MSDERSMEFQPSKDDLQQLREWLQKMPHLLHDYDDEFLKAFIMGCKGSLQKAKDRLDHFNALGKRYPQFFGTYDPLYPPLQENLTARLMFPLPKKTPDGCTVIITCFNPNVDNPKKVNVVEIIRYLLLTFYVLLWENEFVNGKLVYVSHSTGGLSLADINVTPMMLKQIVTSFEKAFPVRLQSVHLFNIASVVEYIFNLIKMISKKKIAERFCLHSQLDGVSQVLPKEILPKEFGGCEESIVIMHENWKKKVESYRERLLEEERRMRELDPLRPKTEDEDEMAGSFRQLQVD